MGNPVIWFYPSATTGLVEIDFGEGLSDLQITPIREAEDARAYDGSLYRSVLSGREQVRIVLDRFTDAALARKFESLQTHLERGGAISFSADKEKAWAGFANSPLAGATEIPTEGHAFGAYYSTPNLSAGDVMCIESVNPEALREFVAVDGLLYDDLSITAQTTILYEYTILPAMVRYRDFWPVLQMPAGELGRAIVTHDHRISYTLDLTLETNPATIAALAGAAGSLGGDGEDTAQGGAYTLEDAAGIGGGGTGGGGGVSAPISSGALYDDVGPGGTTGTGAPSVSFGAGS